MKKVFLLLMFVAICLVSFGCADNRANIQAETMNTLYPDGFRKIHSKDEFTGQTVYSYTVKTKPYNFQGPPKTILFNPAIIEKQDSKILLSNITYIGNTWIFIDKIQLKLDTDAPIDIKIVTQNQNVARGGIVNEVFFAHVGQDLIEKIATSNETTLRVSGKNGYADLQLNDDDKNAMKWLISVYKEINKKEELAVIKQP